MMELYIMEYISGTYYIIGCLAVWHSAHAGCGPSEISGGVMVTFQVLAWYCE